MSIVNMRAAFSDCYIMLEIGVSLNMSTVQNCIIEKVALHEYGERASVVLRNKNDNVDLRNCYIYTQEDWSEVTWRSNHLEEWGTYHLPKIEVITKEGRT